MSTWKPPPISQVWQAIDLFIEAAYENRLPKAVRLRLDLLRSMPADEFFDCRVFERQGQGSAVCRLSLRLGNRSYPHMKLVIEPTPTGEGHMFRADSHDDHVRPPPDSPELKAFGQLVADNQAIADLIEANWRNHGLPTFKAYLREDIDRRSQGRESEFSC